MVSKKEHRDVIMTFIISFSVMIIGGLFLLIISYPDNSKWTDLQENLIFALGLFMIAMGIIYSILVLLWEKRNPHNE